MRNGATNILCMWPLQHLPHGPRFLKLPYPSADWDPTEVLDFTLAVSDP